MFFARRSAPAKRRPSSAESGGSYVLSVAMCAGPAFAIGKARTGSSSSRRSASISGNSGIVDLAVAESVRPRVLLVRHHVELLQAVGAAGVGTDDACAGIREVRPLLHGLVCKRAGLFVKQPVGVEPELASAHVQKREEDGGVAPVRPAALERKCREPEADALRILLAHRGLGRLLDEAVEDARFGLRQRGVHGGALLRLCVPKREN